MYGHNTQQANGFGAPDTTFQSILENAARTIRRRLANYDEGKDPLKRSHLKLLWDIVMIEAERVAAGESQLYSGLESPIKAVQDWGEPADSPLTSSLRKAERYFRQNYRSRSSFRGGRVLACTLFFFLAAAFGSMHIAAQNKVVVDQPSAAAVLWEPVDIKNRDLFLGPGAGAVVPDLKGATVVGRQTGGNNIKYRIKEDNGNEWVAKVADESQPEVAAVRLLWGIGYKTEVDYLVPELTIGKFGTFRNVRLEARPKDWKRGTRWSWASNPFVGTKEFDGLKLMMAMINNWDLKDENTAVIITGDGRQHYVISDLGSSFGRLAHSPNSRAGRSVNDPEGYAKAAFIKGTRNGVLELAYVGSAQHLMNGIKVDHARWLVDLLLQLSDKQIMDAFRAARYSDEKASLLANAFKARIRALDDATRSAVATN